MLSILMPTPTLSPCEESGMVAGHVERRQTRDRQGFKEERGAVSNRTVLCGERPACHSRKQRDSVRADPQDCDRVLWRYFEDVRHVRRGQWIDHGNQPVHREELARGVCPARVFYGQKHDSY